jgi:hypothetical protein
MTPRGAVVTQFAHVFMSDDRWFAYHEGELEETWKHGWGRTEEEARADLARLDQEFLESLQTEEERLLEEQGP